MVPASVTYRADCERLYLGAMMNRPAGQAPDIWADCVKVSHLTDYRHRMIFEAICTLPAGHDVNVAAVWAEIVRVHPAETWHEYLLELHEECSNHGGVPPLASAFGKSINLYRRADLAYFGVGDFDRPINEPVGE